MQGTILLVEDDFALAMGTEYALQAEGYEVVHAGSLEKARELLAGEIDLILLDVMLPDGNGFDFCREIRNRNKQVPILFLTAVGEEVNIVQGLELGADDYVMKPFQPSILYAKVVAMIKRDQKQEEHLLVFGHVQLDRINRILIIDGEKITLAHKEYELLEYMCLHVNQLLSRQVILDKIWGYDYYGDGRAVDTYVKKVRKKLGKYAGYIQTVIKTGYIFKVVDDDEKTKDNNR